MGVMASLQKCPKTGNYIYRKSIRPELRHLIGRGSEWKVSLGTKSLAEARVLFTAEAARCEAAIAAARAALKDEPTLLPADAPKLAAHWIASELAAWEQDPERLRNFLAFSGGEAISPIDILDDDDSSIPSEVAHALRQTLMAVHQPLPAHSSMLYRALYREFFNAWLTLSKTAVQRL